MSNNILWYYQFNNDRAGPVTEEEMVELIARGTVQRGTLVWREGMSDWQQAYLTELSSLFTPSMSADGENSGQLDGIREYLISKVNFPQKLRAWFLIFCIAQCLSVFLAALGPLTLLSAVVSTFFGLLIMYHVWRVIPEDKRMFSPFMTVILMIIPLLNLVWVFYCYYSAAKKINVELAARGEEYRVNEYLALAYGIIVVALSGFFVVTVLSGAVLATLNLTLVVATVFIQIYMMRSFVISLVKLI